MGVGTLSSATRSSGLDADTATAADATTLTRVASPSTPAGTSRCSAAAEPLRTAAAEAAAWRPRLRWLLLLPEAAVGVVFSLSPTGKRVVAAAAAVVPV